MRPIIVWFRQDLRLADHAALHAAVRAQTAIIPLYVLDDATPGAWSPGGASRWWLHHSLAALAQRLQECGASLILRRGATLETLVCSALEVRAAGVYWSRGYEPWSTRLETALQGALAEHGIEARRFGGALLLEPEAVRTADGGSFKVFTPFWKAHQRILAPRAASAAPERIEPYAPALATDRLEDWSLLPRRPDWAGGLRATWTPGEAGGAARLENFVDNALGDYERQRDHPERGATSRLSPHLHFGELSPRQAWQAVERARSAARDERGALAFQRQLAWREFSYHLLEHSPQLPEQPLRSEFAGLAWRADQDALHAWQRGLTGYPIVDAGMRELWHSGWMHNRVRMVAASFLVKHLLVPWTEGERWFWDTLVDADLANNAASWQWIAGCGTDAAPYFRVFNPVLQGRKFDEHGAYVRRWVPELAALPDEHIHAPWLAPAELRARCGVRLGQDYPQPIVDHAAARARALGAYAQLKGG